MSSRDPHVYRPRLADDHLAGLLAELPAVMVTGPRATGKTTTAARHAEHVARLDEPGVAASYRADPDAALRRAPRPLLLDEWQKVPEVLSAVKRSVDRDAAPGQFILTGSVRADLHHETWAGTGRVVRTSMYPLTQRELAGRVHQSGTGFVERLASAGIDGFATPSEPPDIDGYIALAVRGGFPEVASRTLSERARSAWLDSYLDDLVTRDAVDLDGHKDPIKLRRYLTVLALNNAGMPSGATLYEAADINAKTAASYDHLLRNLYVLDVVPAWADRRLKRLTRAGKRYLVDTGLAVAAAGVGTDDVLADHDLVGRTLDAFAAAQLRPELAVAHPRPRLHHLREGAGRHEVDLLVELGPSKVVGIEVKAGVAPTTADAKHLLWLRDRLGERFTGGAVLHTGPEPFELADRIYALPLCSIWT